MRQRKLD